MTIRTRIARAISRALEEAQGKGRLPPVPISEDLAIERPQNPGHGDFASSLPLRLAKAMRADPMSIAERLVDEVPSDSALQRVWAERPGFVNFALEPSWLVRQVDVVRAAGASYGSIGVGNGQRMQVEFVSVNPTGPLHVGHARGSVIGSTLANILEAAGYLVEREYYVNDAGTQVDLFAKSLYARYMQLFDRSVEVPSDGYQGDYLVDVARQIRDEVGDCFLEMPERRAAAELGEMGLERMLDGIRSDLELLNVRFDVWFSERNLYKDGRYEEAMDILRERGFLALREGATWFVSTALGEEKDNVLVRGTGTPTYFASDVAYHYDKFLGRGFDRVIDVWGADHQGHVPRMKAVVGALGIPSEKLAVIISQMVTFKRGEEAVRVSKRTGDIITLRELVDEVGPDACRFHFLSRSPKSQMEFDMELAKRESSENPVYYVQYAHARIASILDLARTSGIAYGDGDPALLGHEAELALIRKLIALPDTVEMIALSLEPHHLPYYAMEVATAFHWFYQQCRVVSGDPGEQGVTKARLKLVDATRIVLARCLDLMAMTAPEKM